MPPSSTLDGLVEAYAGVSAANAAATEQFHAVADLFDREGIPFLVLKGFDVLVRYYGVRGTRPISDIDLLVHEQDLSRIDTLLIGAGYTRQIDGNPCYASPETGTLFDLTTSLWYLDQPGLALLWKHARTLTIPPKTVSTLGADDLLIYLLAYGVVHRGSFTPAWEQDLRLLLMRETPDWEAVVDTVQRCCLSTPVVHGLTYLHRRRPTLPIPEWVFFALAPTSRRERLTSWFLRRLVTKHQIPEIGHVLLWATSPAGTYWTRLRQILFPTNSFLQYRYGASATTAPVLTRLRRLLGLSHSGLILVRDIVVRLLTGPREGRT
ncbi:MAG: nucleotidyltransferase family protein [Nitrospira sp.]